MSPKKNAKKNDKAVEDKDSARIDAAKRWAMRGHGEELAHVWAALTGIEPRILVPQVVGTVLHEGGTRPAWQWKRKNDEFILMAWPQDQPIRAAVLMGGPIGKELKPVTVVPLLEGFPNDLEVEEIHPRQEGGCGDVGALIFQDKNPMWFFDPLFGRDLDDLTPGVTHTFWLAAAALTLRKAMLDEITLTSGPQYEEWAAQWQKENPEARSFETPPLKIDIRGKTMIFPGNVFGEYKIRAKVEKVEDYKLEKMPVKALFLTFPFDHRPDLKLAVYASQAILNGYEPQAGDEIEGYVWLQGRIIDLEQPGGEDDGKA